MSPGQRLLLILLIMLSVLAPMTLGAIDPRLLLLLPVLLAASLGGWFFWQRHDRWRHYEPPAGVTFQAEDQRFTPPARISLPRTGQGCRNVLRTRWGGRDVVAWEERTGVGWEWRCGFPLAHRVPHYVMEPLEEVGGRPAFIQYSALDTHNYSPGLPSSVKALMRVADVSMRWETVDDWLVATESHMSPHELPQWLEAEGTFLAKVADALEGNVSQRPATPAVKALPPANPARNVWQPGEVVADPAPDPEAELRGERAWGQPDFTRRASEQDPRPR